MASQPPQRSRWLSHNSTQESASSSQAQQSSFEAPATSSDNQPISLNKPQSAEATSSKSTSAQTTAATPTLDTAHESSPPKEARICWICQQEDTEDTPENNFWRTPCPCSLTAHDSCLLEWVANEEAPKPGEIAHNRRIVCPQCQAEIKIQRPRDYLVAVVERIQWGTKQMMLPTALSALTGCAYSGLVVYGMNAMQLVFGVEETRAILLQGFAAHETHKWTASWGRKAFSHFLRVMDPFFPTGEIPNATLFFAVPLIGPVLVLLRTKLADQLFPLLLPLYFLKPGHRPLTWPPSPGLTLATIPYLRGFYNEFYRYMFSSLERKWDLAVQRKPREGETAEQIAAQAQVEEEEGHAIFELEWVDEEIEAADNVIIEAAERNVRQANENGNEQPQPEIAADGAPDVGAQPNPPNGGGNGNRNRNNGEWAFQQDIDIPKIASTVIGALFFPAISSIMGDILKYTLPSSLTSPTTVSRFRSEVVTKGLLREKWGRSIIGGCLFVVLKDAVVLYCKWKKARDFGKRKVLDFVGEKKKRVS